MGKRHAVIVCERGKSTHVPQALRQPMKEGIMGPHNGQVGRNIHQQPTQTITNGSQLSRLERVGVLFREALQIFLLFFFFFVQLPGVLFLNYKPMRETAKRLQ